MHRQEANTAVAFSLPARESFLLQAPCATVSACDTLSEARWSCTGAGKKPNVTTPDQVTVTPGESIQDAEGFGLQQSPSSSSPAGKHRPESRM